MFLSWKQWRQMTRSAEVGRSICPEFTGRISDSQVGGGENPNFELIAA